MHDSKIIETEKLTIYNTLLTTQNYTWTSLSSWRCWPWCPR